MRIGAIRVMVTVTNGNGEFVITNLEDKYGPREKQLDIVVELR